MNIIHSGIRTSNNLQINKIYAGNGIQTSAQNLPKILGQKSVIPKYANEKIQTQKSERNILTEKKCKTMDKT